MSLIGRLLYQEGYRPPAASRILHQKKLKAAIEWMGEKYVFHPNYKTNPKHSIYKDKR